MSELLGFGFRWYRSFFGREIQYVAPLTKVNLIAGRNNSGKSNVLRFAHEVLPRANVRGGSFTLPEQRTGSGGQDSFRAPVHGDRGRGLEIVLGVDVPDDFRQFFGESGAQLQSPHLSDVAALFRQPAFRIPDTDEGIWFRFVESAASSLDVGRYQVDPAQYQEAFEQLIATGHGEYIDGALGQLGGVQYMGGNVIGRISKLNEYINFGRLGTSVEFIDAFRQVRNSDDTGSSVHAGAGLINRLAELERPDASQPESRARFDAINRFVQVVLESPEATLEIPHHRRTINVHWNGALMPLESLGTGIHQVIIIAAAATVLQDTLVCIEEPEVHLHPLLQRKLVRYLRAETNNRYLIATHSAHLLDAQLATTFHATHTDDGGTQLRRAKNSFEYAAVCADLGYRPSDLMQANAVIWVEGPSDRIYLTHWLSVADPELTEGLHYSIMFYGGRLLSHLTADDPEVTEFISLRRLNRSLVIMIDSDRTSSRVHVNPTKARVRNEFDRGDGFAWVTSGYAIENYVPKSLLATAIAAAHPKAQTKWDGDQWTNPLAQEIWTGRPRDPDKVKIAREVVSRWVAGTVGLHDLTKRVKQLVRFIRDANGMA